MTDTITVTQAHALSTFATALRRHDLTYEWSDDARIHRRGAAEYDELVRLAKDLPAEDVAPVVSILVRSRMGEKDQWSIDWAESWISGFMNAVASLRGGARG